MNSLNYKEQVAVKCLAAIIKQEPNPLGYDDAKIKLMVSTAFRFAVEFQNRAILFRKEENASETQPAVGVDVDADTLATNTDKILYNINENLKSGIVVKGEAQTLGGTITPLKIKVTELPEIKFDEALNVNVESMPAK